jgi:hypothetical protein
MVHDDRTFRMYAFQAGTNRILYQGAFNNATLRYEYGHDTMPPQQPVLELIDFPSTSDWARAAMVHDGGHYRLYVAASADVTVPNVLRQGRDSAVAAVQAAGLVANTSLDTVGPFDPDGVVLRQFPTPGTAVSPGSSVELVISLSVPS